MRSFQNVFRGNRTVRLRFYPQSAQPLSRLTAQLLYNTLGATLLFAKLVGTLSWFTILIQIAVARYRHDPHAAHTSRPLRPSQPLPNLPIEAPAGTHAIALKALRSTASPDDPRQIRKPLSLRNSLILRSAIQKCNHYSSHPQPTPHKAFGPPPLPGRWPWLLTASHWPPKCLRRRSFRRPSLGGWTSL
jgi:hypothetical protein